MNVFTLVISPDSCKNNQEFTVVCNIGIDLLSNEEKRCAYRMRFGSKNINYVWNTVSVKDHAKKVMDMLKDLSAL